MKRKILAFLLTLVLSFGFTACDAFGLFGNSTNDLSTSVSAEKIATVEAVSEDVIAIQILKASDGEKLLDIMQQLKGQKALDFQTDGSGMLKSINGKENAADWSYCWMLYTSDTEFSNREWGTYTYQDKELGSAIFGAEQLPATVGKVYVWVYKKF